MQKKSHFYGDWEVAARGFSWCETGKHLAPRPKKPPAKGWVCKACRERNKSQQEPRSGDQGEA